MCSVAVFLRLSVPEEVTDYVGNGLMLPAYRYSLLFALIGCGIMLSGEQRPIALVGNLAVLAATLWFALQWAEPIILPFRALAELIVRYPVVASAMGMGAGIALLFPLQTRRWLTPFVCAISGFCLGLFIILESPFDYYYYWFSTAGGLSGMAVIIVSIALANGARQLVAGATFAIAERIFGSWLIAASLLLTALTVMPQRSAEPAPRETTIINGMELPVLP
ncbi:hypothetical protein [Hoeflea sp.]|uniref:hypothetical protein n=1 Tax=Hoeflea sp. TaxID=1940281 RepID=UPI003B01689D